MSMRRIPLWIMVLALSTACSDRAPEPRAEGATGSRTAALAAPDHAVIPAGEAGRLLDVAGDRALVGIEEPALPNADPAMRMAVRLYERGREVAWPLKDRPLAHARLLPGGLVLALTPSGALLEVDPATRSVRQLDDGVAAPIGASPDGAHLAYAKGDAPELEIWRMERASGVPVQVTTDMAPAWSPAVGPDGRTVVFASGRSGQAALWVQGDGAPRVVVPPEEGPSLFPASLTPTLFDGTRVVFEGEAGVVAAWLDGRVDRVPGGASVPHWTKTGEAAVVVGGRVRILEVPR
jgi:hypothetical protein